MGEKVNEGVEYTANSRVGKKVGEGVNYMGDKVNEGADYLNETRPVKYISKKAKDVGDSVSEYFHPKPEESVEEEVKILETVPETKVRLVL